MRAQTKRDILVGLLVGGSILLAIVETNRNVSLEKSAHNPAVVAAASLPAPHEYVGPCYIGETYETCLPKLAKLMDENLALRSDVKDLQDRVRKLEGRRR